MGFKFPEMLHLEISRCWSLVKLVNPKGKILRSLCEISRLVRFGKRERLPKFVNLFWDKLRTLIDEDGPKFELFLNPMVPPSLFLERLSSTKVGMDQNQPGTEPLRELLERSIV